MIAEFGGDILLVALAVVVLIYSKLYYHEK